MSDTVSKTASNAASYIKVYTRTPAEDYPAELAYSIHFAVSRDGVNFVPLNYNCGILYAEAAITQQGCIDPRFLREPVILRCGDTYLITAEMFSFDSPEPPSRIAYVTADFITFTPTSPPSPNICDADSSDFSASPDTSDTSDTSDTVMISDVIAAAAIDRWMPLSAVGVRLPDRVSIASPDELDFIFAEVVYSDGSTDMKRVAWDASPLSAPGEYEISGEIEHTELTDKFPLPNTGGFADPVIFRRGGKFYFIATNDNNGNIGLYMRCAESEDGLFSDDSIPSLILPYDEKRALCGTFWAPELHEIGGELYILFAVSGKSWGPQAHMMKLRSPEDSRCPLHGGEPSAMCPDCWEDPVPVCKKNGDKLSFGITLDMTYLYHPHTHRSYLLWSERYGIGSKNDSGSMIYIAETDEKTPFHLKSDPVLISRPLYGWENQRGTINNEGPYPLMRICGGKIYVAYSGGAAGGDSYCVGYLTLPSSADPLDPSAWSKLPAPALSRYMFSDRLGPGHNSFYRVDDRIMFVYHAQTHENPRLRCSAAGRVHIDASDFPRLDVHGEHDLPKELSRVNLTVNLK